MQQQTQYEQLQQFGVAGRKGEWGGKCTSGEKILSKPFEGKRGRYQLACEKNVEHLYRSNESINYLKERTDQQNQLPMQYQNGIDVAPMKLHSFLPSNVGFYQH